MSQLIVFGGTSGVCRILLWWGLLGPDSFSCDSIWLTHS